MHSPSIDISAVAAAPFAMSSTSIRRGYAVVTVVVMLSVLLGVFTVVNRDRMPHGLGEFLAIRVTIKNLIVMAIVFITSIAAVRIFELSSFTTAFSLWRELLKVTKVSTMVAVSAVLFPLTSTTGAFTGRIICYFLPTAILACVCARLVAHACNAWLTALLGDRRDLIIVGSGPRAASFYKRILESGNSNFRVLGFVDSPNTHQVPGTISGQMLGGLDQLEAILMKQPVDEVLIALPAKSCYGQIQSTIETCERAGVEAKYLSDIFQLSLAKLKVEMDQNTPIVSLKVVQEDYRLLVKRVIDIVGAICGIVVFGPLMLLVAALIKVTSPGPVVFSQERYGFRKRLFHMYKFRTMAQDAEVLQASLECRNEACGPVFKIRDDPRITSIGRILRTTSLDELPQFFNVLWGEMSLVGPRPLPIRDVSRFDSASLMRRFSVKPGLTCLWQINGRSDTTFDRWIALDLKYIDEWSLGLDFHILVRTVPSVLSGRGAT